MDLIDQRPRASAQSAPELTAPTPGVAPESVVPLETQGMDQFFESWRLYPELRMRLAYGLATIPAERMDWDGVLLGFQTQRPQRPDLSELALWQALLSSLRTRLALIDADKWFSFCLIAPRGLGLEALYFSRMQKAAEVVGAAESTLRPHLFEDEQWQELVRIMSLPRRHSLGPRPWIGFLNAVLFDLGRENAALVEIAESLIFNDEMWLARLEEAGAFRGQMETLLSEVRTRLRLSDTNTAERQ